MSKIFILLVTLVLVSYNQVNAFYNLALPYDYNAKKENFLKGKTTVNDDEIYVFLEPLLVS